MKANKHGRVAEHRSIEYMDPGNSLILGLHKFIAISSIGSRAEHGITYVVHAFEDRTKPDT